MDSGENPPYRQQAKLQQVKDSVSPQILDYFQRFGQNRDLEQYLFSHGAPKSGTSSSIRTDATEFVTARCLNPVDDHRQCQINKLSTREIISRSLDSDNRECDVSFKSLRLEPFSLKKLTRSYNLAVGDPPKEMKEQSASPFPEVEFPLSDRSDKSARKYCGEIADDENQLDQSTIKPGSPGSSVTRKLEWDSLADVGYAADAKHGGFSEQNLSTLERMALHSRYRDNEAPSTRIPPQTSDIEMQNVIKMGIPNAQSTPETEKENIASNENLKIKSKTSFTKICNVRVSKKPIRHTKNSGTYRLDCKNYQDSSSIKIDMTKKISFDVQQGDKNYSSDDINAYHTGEEQSKAVSKRELEQPVADCSIPSPLHDVATSTDSKSTLPTEVSVSNKEIQTSYRGTSISASAQTIGGEDGYPFSNILNSKVPIILNVLQKHEKPVTFSTKRRRKRDFKLPQKIYALPHKEVSESYVSEDDAKVADSENFAFGESAAKCSDSILTRADSFEYLPGHMFQNKNLLQETNSQSIPESSQGAASSGSLPPATTSSECSKTSLDIFKMFELSSFSRDLNSSIDLISKLVDIKHRDPELKKKLVKGVIQILIKNNYPEDENSDSKSDKLTPDTISDDKMTCNSEMKSAADSERNVLTNSEGKKKTNLEENISTNVEVKATISSEIKMTSSDSNSLSQKSDHRVNKIVNNKLQRELNTNFLLNRHNLIQRSLTADTPLFTKSENSTRSIKSAPVSLSYLDYLGNKAKSAPNSDVLNLNNIENISESHSKPPFSGKSGADDKTIQSMEVSGMTSSIFSSTPKYSSSGSKQESKKGRTKSEEIYEQYLIEKIKEDEKCKRRQLRDEANLKKKKEMLLEKDLALCLSRINRANSSSSHGSNVTQKHLSLINEEILQLTILKLKLENKHIPENLKLLKGDKDPFPLSQYNIKDQGASGDRGSTSNKHSVVPEHQSTNLAYYSTVASPSPKSEKYVHIPPLNLKKSSEDSCENSLSNAVQLSRPSPSRIGARKKKLSSSSSRNNSRVTSVSPHTSIKKTQKCYESGTDRSRPTTRYSINNTKDKEKPHLSKNRCLPINVDSDCICNDKESCCKLQPSFPKSSRSSTVRSVCGKPSLPGILCPCCRSNLVSSSSSICDTTKTSTDKANVSRELQKLEKIFEKYQKCKILQSFMKEYDDLVSKYTEAKKEKLAAATCAKKENLKSASHPPSSTSSNAVKICIPLPKETRIPPTPVCAEIPKISSIFYENNNNISPKSVPSTSRSKSSSPCHANNLEVITKKKSPVSRSPRATEKYYVDAFTSPIVTPELKLNPECLRAPVCQDKQDILSDRVSVCPPTSDKKDASKCLDTARTYSKSSDISDRLIEKVRKAFSKEYSDIVQRYGKVKSDPCSECPHRKPNCDDCSLKNNLPMVNTVNVSASAPYTLSTINKLSKSKDRPRSTPCDSKTKESKVSERVLPANIVAVCPICKLVPLSEGFKSCLDCAKKQRKIIAELLKREEKQKCSRKPIAYNLVVESCDSYLEETLPDRRLSLDEIIVKVPRLRNKKDSCKKNGQQALRVQKCIDEESIDKKGSTDEQIDELSSLNSNRSQDSASDNPPSCSYKENEVPSACINKKYNLSVGEYLQLRRPNFICEADRRQQCLKKIHQLRRQRDMDLRIVLSLGVSCLPNIKQIELSDLECIARKHGILLPKRVKRMFDPNEMVRKTARQYKKLPEILRKKYDLKKEQEKKTNLLMADLFAKKLKERTLKGFVNVSHGSNVISL